MAIWQKQKVIIIGSGFSGLSAACYLAKEGYEVIILEKNKEVGGRARSYTDEGFMFDMGPSWYWMPDVFEDFFSAFGKKVSDYYDLRLLSPSFTVYFDKGEKIDIPSSQAELENLFESIEPGSGRNLRKFLKEAKYKYEIGMKKMAYKPALSWLEFMNAPTLVAAFRLRVFQSLQQYVRTHFTNPRLISILEFPVLFLGAQAKNTPALYSLMNYAGLSLGTWYPMGGMKKIVDALHELAVSQGVKIHASTPAGAIVIDNGKALGVNAAGRHYAADVVIAAADYQHVEEKLLPETCRNYSGEYWHKRTMAPSALIFYLGINKQIKQLQHHNLFFDEDMDVHANEIYNRPQWPTRPLFYACCPSKTDDTVAPAGMENLFLLIPLASGLKDSESEREKYFNLVVNRLEKKTGENIRQHIIYKKSYAMNDFVNDYNAFKGNAYGLANTLKQTAVFKPSIRNKKIPNLFYCGQLTVPGPGVPPALISGQVVAKEAIKQLNRML